MDRRIRKTKQAFHEALLQLLEQQDFRDLTITDIVKAADVNRSTFYKHYVYKEDLLNEIIEQVLHDLTNSYLEPYRQQPALDVRTMVASTVKIFDHVAQHHSFYRLILSSQTLLNFQLRICERLQALCLNDMQASLPDVQHRQQKQVEAGIYASYQAHAIWGMIVYWAQQDFRHSAHEMAEQLLLILNFRPLADVQVTHPSTWANESSLPLRAAPSES
ncbi:TetR/AcrR family transcriptional regulator [Paenibacillus sp. WLX1005]|uniref:TetR/AcrR family transcriptional regulator n=1 Tax=unclassified Paenibacillus TaxID=185978 RepID=UPI0039845F6F